MTELPPLPLEEWEQTKDTLHLYIQEIGKVQLAARAPRNHWWHVTLKPTARGVSTGRMQHDGTHFDIEADFIDHNARTAGWPYEELESRWCPTSVPFDSRRSA